MKRAFPATFLSFCLIGAFLGDKPTDQDIRQFQKDYGRKPAIVLIFLDWNALPDKDMIQQVYGEGSQLLLTWEPWTAADQKGIDFDQVLKGQDDAYLRAFAQRVKSIPGRVYIRFAHEANGDWYPWSGSKIGKEKYVALYRYVVDFFNQHAVDNVDWVYSVNWEDVPKKNNHYSLYYPGNAYVDMIGIDGYNWGQERWMSFERIFIPRYRDIVLRYGKPVIISEFSSAEGSPGMKAYWIREAMRSLSRMKEVKAFVLFNVDKEAAWRFSPEEDSGLELKKQLQKLYFTEK